MVKNLTDLQIERIISRSLKKYSFDISAEMYFNGRQLPDNSYFTLSAVKDYLTASAEYKQYYYDTMMNAFISHTARQKDIHTNSTVNFYYFCKVNRNELISRVNVDISAFIDYCIRNYLYYGISDYIVLISAFGISAVNREISNILYSNKRKYKNADIGILKPIETDNSNRAHNIDGYISVMDKLKKCASAKQWEILQYKKQGYQNADIARLMNVSKQAIDIQLNRLYSKYQKTV